MHLRPRAWAEIDLAAIAANTARLVDAAGNAEVMAVVKADAYGHGLVPVARTARSAGATWLGVALLEEALVLRSVGDTGRILAWLPTPGDQFGACVRDDIDIGAADEDRADLFADSRQTVHGAARQAGVARDRH